jgi:hypothetical protein
LLRSEERVEERVEERIEERIEERNKKSKRWLYPAALKNSAAAMDQN